MDALTDEQRAQVARWVPLAIKLARQGTRGQAADMDDAVGDALLQLCRSARTFDPGYGMTFQTHGANGVKLATIKNYHRRLAGGFAGLTGRKTAQAVAADRPRAVGVKAAHDRPGPGLVEPAEFSTLVTLALSCLTPAQRRAVLAWHVEGRPIAEVAAAEGTSPRAARGRVEAGLRRLRAVLAGSAGVFAGGPA